MNFISKNLQDAFDKAKPVLEKITETKDQISKEITFLEKSLQAFAISDDFTYFIKSPYDTTSFADGNIGEYSLSGWAITNEEMLTWDKNKKRLMYQLNQYEAEVDFESKSPVVLKIETRKTILCKPLIETAFDIRKEVYENEHLTRFLNALTAQYQLALRDPSDSTDIPF